MTNLKIAAAAVIGEGSDVKIYTQNLISTIGGDVEGFGVEETAILSPYGLDTLCNTMSLYHPPFTTSGEAHLKASLHLPEEWAEQATFLADMREKYGVDVLVENHPYKPAEKILSVTGLENILHFGQELRSSYAEVHLEVDDVPRPIIHPEIIGQLMDDAVHYAEHSQAFAPNAFLSNAYKPHDWQI